MFESKIIQPLYSFYNKLFSVFCDIEEYSGVNFALLAKWREPFSPPPFTSYPVHRKEVQAFANGGIFWEKLVPGGFCAPSRPQYLADEGVHLGGLPHLWPFFLLLFRFSFFPLSMLFQSFRQVRPLCLSLFPKRLFSVKIWVGLAVCPGLRPRGGALPPFTGPIDAKSLWGHRSGPAFAGRQKCPGGVGIPSCPNAGWG